MSLAVMMQRLQINLAWQVTYANAMSYVKVTKLPIDIVQFPKAPMGLASWLNVRLQSSLPGLHTDAGFRVNASFRKLQHVQDLGGDTVGPEDGTTLAGTKLHRQTVHPEFGRRRARSALRSPARSSARRRAHPPPLPPRLPHCMLAQPRTEQSISVVVWAVRGVRQSRCASPSGSGAYVRVVLNPPHWGETALEWFSQNQHEFALTEWKKLPFHSTDLSLFSALKNISNSHYFLRKLFDLRRSNCWQQHFRINMQRLFDDKKKNESKIAYGNVETLRCSDFFGTRTWDDVIRAETGVYVVINWKRGRDFQSIYDEMFWKGCNKIYNISFFIRSWRVEIEKVFLTSLRYVWYRIVEIIN